MKKGRGKLPVLVCMLSGLLFFIFAGNLSYTAHAAQKSSAASTASRSVSSTAALQNGTLPTAQAVHMTEEQAVQEQRTGGFAFLLILLSAVAVGCLLFLRARHGKQRSTPVALGSSRKRPDGKSF